jgi:hydroxypyruvate reductase
MSDERRRLLLHVYERALAAVNGRSRVREALTLMTRTGRWRAVAVGKAASAMTLGALDILGENLERALVISKDEHFDAALFDAPRVGCLAAGHPLPDERSIQAGDRLLDFVRKTPRDETLLFLISGGASSLVEVLPAGMSLDDLRKFNHWALASGHDIVAVNAVRRRLSMIKNGALLAELQGRPTVALYLSDVPGDDPALIGSGLLSEPREIPMPENLPFWIARLVRPPAPMPASAANVSHHVIAALEDALQAACAAGEARGLRVERQRGRFRGEATELATRFCHELALSDGALLVWGGESTVRLPRRTGRGGRNQHLALAAARLLGVHDDLTLLAAGTDGTDGPTSDAGAIVDSTTVERGTLAGLDADDCLARADSGRFLEAAGDLLHTGPTGTNVGDLVLGLKGSVTSITFAARPTM